MRLTEHFSSEEFVCHHCGAASIKQEFVELLEQIRIEIGAPIHVHSGYRCPLHPVEAVKTKPGQHAHGTAADISSPGVSQEVLFRAIRQHPELHGIGVDKGSYIHVDMRPGPLVMWTYRERLTHPWNGDWEMLRA